MIAKLPDSLCWLSQSRTLPALARLAEIYVRNDSGNPLIMDALYIDAPGEILATAIVFNRSHILAAPVPVHSVESIGRPRLLPIGVFRGGRRIEPSQDLTVRLDNLGDDQTVSVLIRCREVYP